MSTIRTAAGITVTLIIVTFAVTIYLIRRRSTTTKLPPLRKSSKAPKPQKSEPAPLILPSRPKLTPQPQPEPEPEPVQAYDEEDTEQDAQEVAPPPMQEPEQPVQVSLARMERIEPVQRPEPQTAPMQRLAEFPPLPDEIPQPLPKPAPQPQQKKEACNGDDDSHTLDKAPAYSKLDLQNVDKAALQQMLIDERARYREARQWIIEETKWNHMYKETSLNNRKLYGENHCDTGYTVLRNKPMQACPADNEDDADYTMLNAKPAWTSAGKDPWQKS